MSITSSFYTGLSGLSTHGTAMGVIGDNISNINTTGYKNSAPQFEDILGQSLSGVQGSNQTGAGTNVQSIDVNYTQGTFSTTEVATDVAINGRGFFIVKNPTSDERFYTRAGHYHFDNEGYYVNGDGKRVQGFLYDNAGTTLIESLSDIQVNQNSMIAPQVTTTAEMILNLDSSAEADPIITLQETTTADMVLNLDSTAAVLVWDIDDPGGTSNFDTTVTIYDTLGEAHDIEVYFNKVDATNWNWNALIATSDTDAGGVDPYQLFGHGSFVFTAGVLTTPAADLHVDLHDQIDHPITYHNGEDATDSTIDFTDTVLSTDPSVLSVPIIQNGNAPGGGWDIDDPNGTSNFSTPITIYDTLGQAHVIQVYFTNISDANNPRTWQWHAAIARSDTLAGGTGYTLFGEGETMGDDRLEFDVNGLLESPVAAIDFHDQTANEITYANGVAATDSSIDFTGTTQYGANSAIQNINQDGYAPGSASAIGIDDQGNLTASYTNGQVKRIARLGLANFPNINGLSRRGGTLYSETVGSGSPLTNKPGVGGMGTISSSMLEESNVDLAGEIIKMIIIQRGYEANSKVISTTDAMMNTLINIR